MQEDEVSKEEPSVDREVSDEGKRDYRNEPKKEPKEEDLENCLKVKADPVDIKPEDRKKNVKKLAGAISHSLRASGDVNVRCFGNASIGKAAKALAIAKDYISIPPNNLRLECSPGFITTNIGGNELTGICFYTFADNKEFDTDLDSVKSVLRVTADKKDIDPEERRTNVKKLAGAIAHSLEDNKEVVIRCFGNATIGKASKALAIARGFISPKGSDLYCWPSFIVADMNGNERTGIAFYAYTNNL